MEKEVFVEVTLASVEVMCRDIWITLCRATTIVNYTDPLYYDLISDGCPKRIGQIDTVLQHHQTRSTAIQLPNV